MNYGYNGDEPKQGSYKSIGTHNKSPVFKSRTSGHFCLHNSRKVGVRWTGLRCEEMSKSETDYDSQPVVMKSKKNSKCPEYLPSKQWMVFVSGTFNNNITVNMECATPS